MEVSRRDQQRLEPRLAQRVEPFGQQQVAVARPQQDQALGCWQEIALSLTGRTA
jgi:hypothetical protein